MDVRRCFRTIYGSRSDSKYIMERHHTAFDKALFAAFATTEYPPRFWDTSQLAKSSISELIY